MRKIFGNKKGWALTNHTCDRCRTDCEGGSTIRENVLLTEWRGEAAPDDAVCAVIVDARLYCLWPKESERTGDIDLCLDCRIELLNTMLARLLAARRLREIAATPDPRD